MNFTRRIVTLMLTLVISVGTLSLTAHAAENTMYGIGFVTADALRLRSSASTGAKTLDSAPEKDCVVVIGKEGSWYKVNYNLQEGYMHSDYLTVLTKENAELGYGKVIGTNVNLRSGPSTSHSSVAKASKDDKCYILGLNNGWYKVIYKDKICYIRSDFLELTEIPYENKESSNSPKFYRGGKSTGVKPSASALSGSTEETVPPSTPNHTVPEKDENSSASTAKASGAEILAEAEKHLGVRYVYGGASPSGFDCSGFVYYVLKQTGYSPSRTLSKLYTMGDEVEKDDLQIGDIVFFSNTYGSGLSHVGIYSGDGEFIHAPNSRSTVSYSDLTSGYWANHYHGARRMN